jgi:ubiquinone/menaquinone biosynthesis C-methylase UbiE
MADWDATRYHALSDPQLEWGRRVIVRLDPQPGERILDLGCGTGRLTHEIVDAMETGLVVGTDISASMLNVARGAAHTIPLVRASGLALPFAPAFDAVFSAATLHWIQDHDRAFREVYESLKPGGRFIAQAGGGRNLQRLLDDAHALMDSKEYASHFEGWSDPWNFASADVTQARLEQAGFRNVRAWLEEAPTPMGDRATFTDFIACVCVRHHVDRLPETLRGGFVDRLADRSERGPHPFVLDYWRLNIDARRPAS